MYDRTRNMLHHSCIRALRSAATQYEQKSMKIVERDDKVLWGIMGTCWSQEGGRLVLNYSTSFESVSFLFLCPVVDANHTQHLLCLWGDVKRRRYNPFPERHQPGPWWLLKGKRAETLGPARARHGRWGGQ